MSEIYGIGTDMVDISRVERLLKRHPERFVRRALTPDERAAFLRRPSKVRTGFIAKRFAAKEAFVKALGTGFRWPAVLSQISVINDPRGKPFFRFGEALGARLAEAGIGRCHLTLTDDGGWAMATTILLESQERS